MLTNKFSVLALCITLLSLWGCKDEATNYQLTLSATEGNGVVTLTWNNLNLKGFKNYQIMRCANNYGQYSTISNTITEQNETSFTDTNYPIIDSVYYKIVALADDNVSSNNTLLKTGKLFTSTDQIMALACLPGTNKVVILTYSNISKLAIVNMDTKTIEKEVTVGRYVKGSVNCGIYNGKTEIYLYDNSSYNVHIYDASTLTELLKSNGYYNGYYTNYKVVNDTYGNVYFISSDYLYQMNRQGVMQSKSLSQTPSDLRFDSITNTVSVLCPSTLYNFIISAKGTMTQSSKLIDSGSYNCFLGNSNYLSYNGSSYIKVYDYSTGTSGSLNNSYALNNLMYKNGCIYGNYQNSNLLMCFKKEDAWYLSKSFPYRMCIQKICANNNYLFMAGYFNNNGINTYVVDKIELLQ